LPRELWDSVFDGKSFSFYLSLKFKTDALVIL